MTIQEAVLRSLAQIQPLLPYVIFVTAVTLAVLPALIFMARNIWVNQRRFRWFGLLFGLKGSDCVRLAAAWIKLLLLLAYLVGFQKLIALHYVLILGPGLVYALAMHSILQIPGRIMWLALEMIGLVSCNLVCGYIRDMGAGVGFWIVYILISVFTALFGVYLFLTELNDISAGRSTDVGGEWDSYADEDG